jgi:hypothetical protein
LNNGLDISDFSEEVVEVTAKPKGLFGKMSLAIKNKMDKWEAEVEELSKTKNPQSGMLFKNNLRFRAALSGGCCDRRRGLGRKQVQVFSRQ